MTVLSIVVLLLFISVRATQPVQPEGRLVDVGGYRLNIVCVGTGSPAVVLEAGSGDTSSVWARVQRGLASTARTCAYDRAGSGSSERGPGPRTMRQEVFELHLLLEAADIGAPYVLVGHSYGGLLVRLFSGSYPSEVGGVVLVDPTHENTRLSVQRRGDPQPSWVRVRESARGLTIPAPRRAVAGEPPIDNASYWPDELQQMYEARQKNPVPLGDRPLIVLAGTRPQPPLGGASDAQWQELVKEKDLEKEDLAKLSRNSKLVRDASSGHHIQQDNPSLVISAIAQVVDAVRNGTRIR